MSFVHVLLLSGGKAYYLHLHYTAAKRLLEQGPKEFAGLLRGHCSDAGWLALDYDRKTIVNAQDAFALPKTMLEVIEL